MNKRIAIIGSLGIPARYGGFETLTQNLTQHLSKEYEITVFCSSKTYDVKLKDYNHVRLKYVHLNGNGFQSILYDAVSILEALRLADTLLILGTPGSIILPFVKLFFNKKIVINMDGLEYKRKKWNRAIKLFLKISERIAIRYADRVITDNKILRDYVLKKYGKQSTIIEYGGDHTKRLTLSDKLRKKYGIYFKKYAFSVCRIEPENNIHMILQAFCRIKTDLIIVGNWNDSRYGQVLKRRYGHFSNILLLDPIYDLNELDQIRSNCIVYIHGHSVGGTNPSLVEAMFLGLPVLAYDVNYNRETTQNEAIYFKDSSGLTKLFENTSKESLMDMGKNMFKIASKRYVWHKITKQYSDIF